LDSISKLEGKIDFNTAQLIPGNPEVLVARLGKSNTELVLTKAAHGKIADGFVVSLDGEALDIARTHDRIISNSSGEQVANFNGSTFVRKINGSFVSEAKYVNGVRSLYRVVSKARAGTTVVMANGEKKTVNGSCTDWYLDTIYPNGVIISTYIGTTCVGCETSSITVRGGRMRVECGGGGDPSPGPGGTPTNPPNPVDTITDGIINAVTIPCIKEAVKMAIAGGANTTIKSMLNNVFTGNNHEGWEITFKESYMMANDIAGTARQDGLASVEVLLNSNLVDRSKEFALATVYHEILHGIIATTQPTVDGRIQIDDQHEIMAEQYVTLLIGALRINFPTLSLNDAWGLAWGGLEETNLFTKKLTETEREQVISVNTRHRKSTPSGQRLGSYCN